MIVVEHEIGALSHDPTRRVAFLDRDGVIIENRPEYLLAADQIHLVPRATSAIHRLRAHGFLTVVVTNQACVGKGKLSLAAMLELHLQVVDELRNQGAPLHASVVCPHAPEADCPCRKPREAMLQLVLRTTGGDAQSAVMVGDSAGDLRAAQAVGCQPYLVRTGLGAATAASLKTSERSQTSRVDSLWDAVERITSSHRR